MYASSSENVALGGIAAGVFLYRGAQPLLLLIMTVITCFHSDDDDDQSGGGHLAHPHTPCIRSSIRSEELTVSTIY